jgi:NAD(P)H-dependent flavin oxidoreductase YrpB (nitropropane dioxygenase family)
MLRTSFTELVGCSAPIQLAGMGPVCTPELAAAVSEAGGLGQVTAIPAPVEVVSATLDAIAVRTSKPFGVNLLIPVLPDRECLELIARRARVVDFFWGEPDPLLVELVHAGGALASWQVGSLGEALTAVAAGCDFIIAQGIEAGGHIRGQLGLLPLLGAVLDAVAIPVLAAGDIGNPRGLAAVLAAGAAGVRLGTRFIAARESGAHPTYVDALIQADAGESVRTTRYSIGCPLCPSTHGVLRSALERAEVHESEVVGELEMGGKRLPIARFQGVPPPTKAVTGAVEAMVLYAGQSVGDVRRVQPAAEIVRELVEGAERLLQARQ